MTAIYKHYKARPGSTLVHWSRLGRTSLCRVSIRSRSTMHVDAVTCLDCIERLADGALSRAGRGSEDTIMDVLHQDALDIVTARKHNARTRWEQSVLVDVCHELAIAEGVTR
jgi:hypothetical protein